MQDRVSASPGRVLITPESGEAYYATIERADNPTVEGTPLNKENLLKDRTASILGLTPEAVVDDAFMALIIGADNYGFKLHVTFENGVPYSNAPISGLKDFYGNSLYTDENGDAFGVSKTSTANITISSIYVDIAQKSVDLVANGKITSALISMSKTEYTELTIQSTTKIKFSPLVDTYDVCLVAAGGGGGAGTEHEGAWAGAGGGGGEIKSMLNIDRASNFYIGLTIGSGGKGASTEKTNGLSGGNTTLDFYDESGEISTRQLTAIGGGGGDGSASNGNLQPSGGTGHSNGGRGGDGGGQKSSHDEYVTGGYGGSCTGYKFDEPSLGVPGGGGGGGGSERGIGTSKAYSAPGGSPNGGDGGGHSYNGNNGRPQNIYPEAGKLPGGGGGGGAMSSGNVSSAAGFSGANGANGSAFLRWRWI